jgi:hypothetical protein
VHKTRYQRDMWLPGEEPITGYYRARSWFAVTARHLPESSHRHQDARPQVSQREAVWYAKVVADDRTQGFLGKLQSVRGAWGYAKRAAI